jgi:hypothetical protein
MNLDREILDLAIELQILDCFGCNHKCPSQTDHTCMDQYYYELALYRAIELTNSKYNISVDRAQVFDRLKNNYPYY